MTETMSTYRAVRTLEQALNREFRNATACEEGSLEVYVLEAMSATPLAQLPREERQILLQHGQGYLELRKKEEELLARATEEWYDLDHAFPRIAGVLLGTMAVAGLVAYYLTQSKSQALTHAIVTGPIITVLYQIAIEELGRRSRTLQNLFAQCGSVRPKLRLVRGLQRLSRDITEMQLR